MNKRILRNGNMWAGNFFTISSSVGNVLRKMIFFLALFSTTATFGQTVKELSAQMKEMKSGSDETTLHEATRFDRLLHDLQPTVYVKKETIKTFGNSTPVCARVDAGAIDKLYENNPFFRQVELIKIRIVKKEDLTQSLKLNELRGFSNLKYVLIRCSFPCSEELVKNMLSGNKEGLIICYEVSIPS